MYFIVSPRSILVSCTRDMNDHVLWLVKQRRFDEALDVAEANPGRVQVEAYEHVGVPFQLERHIIACSARTCAIMICVNLCTGHASNLRQRAASKAQRR